MLDTVQSIRIVYIHRMLKHFVILLKQVRYQSRAATLGFSPTDVARTDVSIKQRRDTEAGCCIDTCIHEIFEAQVERHLMPKQCPLKEID